MDGQVNHIHLRIPPVDTGVAEAPPARAAKTGGVAAVLLGGDIPGYRWRNAWQSLAGRLNGISRNTDWRFLLSTSRRTGGDGEKQLRETIGPDVLDDALWYGASAGQGVQPFLDRSGLVIVSEDSMAMLAEAIASRRPVIALRPEADAKPRDWRNETILAQMMEDRRILRLPVSELDGASLDRAFVHCRILDRDPALDLAERLRPYL